jgi:hypothetical protein
MLLILIACIYFFDEYRREYHMAVQRNSTFARPFAGIDWLAKTIAERRAVEQALAGKLAELRPKVETALRSCEAALRRFEQVADDAAATIEDVRKAHVAAMNATSKFTQVHADMMRGHTPEDLAVLRAFSKELAAISQPLQQLVAEYSTRVALHPPTVEGLTHLQYNASLALSTPMPDLLVRNQQDAALLREFRTLHVSIDKTQRFALGVRDRYVPTLMFGAVWLLTSVHASLWLDKQLPDGAWDAVSIVPLLVGKLAAL